MDKSCCSTDEALACFWMPCRTMRKVMLSNCIMDMISTMCCSTCSIAHVMCVRKVYVLRDDVSEHSGSDLCCFVTRLLSWGMRRQPRSHGVFASTVV